MSVTVSNTGPANGTAAIFTLIDRLCNAGWLVKAWSDATTYTGGVSLSTNPFGSSASGAGNLGNTSAWFRIAAPDGSREWMFQRGASDVTWSVARSRLGYTGGSPNATTLPTDATSGQAMFASATFFAAPPGAWNISCETGAPYGFFAWAISASNVKTILIDEPLLANTYPAADADPVMSCAYYSAGGLTGPNPTLQVSLEAIVIGYKRMRHGLGSASNVRVTWLHYLQPYFSVRVAPPTGASAQVGPDPITNSEAPMPIQAAVDGATGVTKGWVGTCGRVRWGSVYGRDNGSGLHDAAGSLDWVYCAGVWVPWDGSAITLY